MLHGPAPARGTSTCLTGGDAPAGISIGIIVIEPAEEPTCERIARAWACKLGPVFSYYKMLTTYLCNQRRASNGAEENMLGTGVHPVHPPALSSTAPGAGLKDAGRPMTAAPVNFPSSRTRRRHGPPPHTHIQSVRACLPTSDILPLCPVRLLQPYPKHWATLTPQRCCASARTAGPYTRTDAIHANAVHNSSFL